MRAAPVIALAAVACRSPGSHEERPVDPPVEIAAAAADAAPRAPAPDASPAVPAPDQPVVSFGGASVFGSESLVILPTGSASETIRRPRKPDQVKSGMLQPKELAALRDGLKSAGCCALTSQRTVGVPDEGHTNLNLGFPGLVCSVSLWDNEWSELPAAKTCAAILERVSRRLR